MLIPKPITDSGSKVGVRSQPTKADELRTGDEVPLQKRRMYAKLTKPRDVHALVI